MELPWVFARYIYMCSLFESETTNLLVCEIVAMVVLTVVRCCTHCLPSYIYVADCVRLLFDSIDYFYT